MIYQRPIHEQHPVARVTAGVLLVAMLVLGFLGSPPPVKAQVVEWRDPVGLPALDGNNGTGRAAPAPLDVELDGSYPVSVSTMPTLVWKDVPEGVGQVTFAITTLAEKNPKVLWSRTVAVGPNGVAKVTVTAGTVAQGRTYAWSAASTSNPGVDNGGPFSLTIDVQRSGSQPTYTAGNLGVTKGTGELVYTYAGPSMNSVAGPIGWTLVHRPTNTPQSGLPDGWRLVVSGSTGWDGLRLNGDGSVTLSTSTGISVTYIKRGGNQWEPQIGGFNVAGESTLLAQNADGTFSATDGNRTVTVFSRPSESAQGRPVRIWSLDTPSAQQTWADGRLRGLIDPVSDNSIAILYGGEEGCATTLDPGFVQAPAGMLCGTIDATGNVVLLQYVEVGGQVQIGRIVSGLGAGIYAASTDIGWDDSGRIVETRSPLAAAAVATDVVAGLGPQDPRVLTQIAYDARGRVASLTAPAGLIAGNDQPAAREERSKTLFSYAPFTVRTAGVTTPRGFDAQDWLDPVTLRVVKRIDESGNTIAFEYDASGNVTRAIGLSTNAQSVTRYDRYGRPVEQIGPTRGLLTSPTAPLTTTAYDQDEQGRDWKGLAARYWSNAGFNGAPAGGSTGPIVAGSVVAGLQFNWPSNPAGGSGPWSARLTGVYEAPTAGTYRFETQTSAKLWVNSRLCATTCTVTLGAGGAAALQIDVVSADGAAAGMKVMVTGPDGKQAPVPTAQLRPNYGLATSSTVRENTGNGIRTLVTKMVYDPVTTQLLKTISPSGATIMRTYEPYTPANDQWGRSTSVTDASGKTTTSSYYAKNAVAPDCSGQLIDQSGGVKSVNLPDGQVVGQVASPDGGVLTGADGASTACTRADAGNLSFSTETTGAGAAVTSYTFPVVAGNPLVSGDAVVSGAETTTTLAFVDTNGRAWKTVDEHGTTTVRQWDAVRGYLERVIETTKAGQTRTTEYTYGASGQVATVTVNGNLLLTNVYAPDGKLLRTELANGAVQTFELDQNNNRRKNTTRFPDGTELTETLTHSPSGRLLSRTIVGPSGTSTFDYDYNVDGRLIDTRLTGTIPATETRWQSAYTGPDGLNGNRASETTTRADGTQATASFTYGADNRLLTADGERFSGPIQYDAAGRATKIGDVDLAYDAAGHLLSAADDQRSYAFSDAGTTTTLTQTINGEQTTLTATTSGESLVLGADKRIDAQLLSPAPGLQVVLNENGAPARWVYSDALGNDAWSSAGNRAPTKTQLYSPDGEEISVVRSRIATPIGLILDGLGWQSGNGASNLRLSTPITIIGDRSYAPDAGRWLQADPTVGGSMNAYEYAAGDPINLSDSTGNAPSFGAIIGMVTAAVVGIAIGSLTFGVGTAAVAGYGYGALLTQIAVGIGVGAISGAVGETVQQLVDAGGVTDWSKVGIAAGFGAASGAVFSGLSAAVAKIWIPGKAVRLMAANTEAERRSMWTLTAYGKIRVEVAGLGKQSSTGRMFTTGSWKKDLRATKLTSGRDPVYRLSDIERDGGVAKFLKKRAGAPGAARPSSDRLSADDLNQWLKRPASGGQFGVADDALQVQQQRVVSNSLRSDAPVSGTVNAKSGVLEQAKGGNKAANSIYDEVRASQKTNYEQYKQFSREVDEASLSNLSGEVPPDLQAQFQNFLLQQIKFK